MNTGAGPPASRSTSGDTASCSWGAETPSCCHGSQSAGRIEERRMMSRFSRCDGQASRSVRRH
jgi:hypothetical protein